MKKNDVFVLTVDNIGAEGEGICRADGMAVFVPYALPGEKVKVLILKCAKNYAFGKLLQVLEKSPERVTPPCPYYEKCGGCSCQHMSYEGTLDFKREQIKSCLERIGGLTLDVPPVLGMEDPWHYRNKTALPVGGAANDPQIGFYSPRSHRIVDVGDCLIATEQSNRACETIKKWMKQYAIEPYHEETHTGLVRHAVVRTAKNSDTMAVLVINGQKLPHDTELIAMLRESVPETVSVCICENTERGNVILGKTYKTLWGKERLIDTLCGFTFELSPLSFYQVNSRQTEVLYRLASDFASLTGNETVADVYCGAGTISLMLAQKAKRVIGIEIVADAVDDAKENAARNHVENTDFRCGAAEAVLPELVSQGLRPDVVVLDPPRKGAAKEVLEAIAQSAPERIVYVSCNVATQARDVKILCENGYQAVKTQGVDMFSWTGGVENVMLLTKQS